MPISDEWSFPEGVTYLNHGSFGPSPRCVRESRHRWTERLEQQPMDFFLRQMESELDHASKKLGQFIGADGNDLLFCDNATVAMNIVANSFPLQPGDEVLVSDQEYGAVLRIWRRACDRWSRPPARSLRSGAWRRKRSFIPFGSPSQAVRSARRCLR